MTDLVLYSKNLKMFIGCDGELTPDISLAAEYSLYDAMARANGDFEIYRSWVVDAIKPPVLSEEEISQAIVDALETKFEPDGLYWYLAACPPSVVVDFLNSCESKYGLVACSLYNQFKNAASLFPNHRMFRPIHLLAIDSEDDLALLLLNSVKCRFVAMTEIKQLMYDIKSRTDQIHAASGSVIIVSED